MTTEIEDACRGLQAAVNQFCKKYQKRFRGTGDELEVLQKHVAYLVKHAQHILRQLAVKRKSLQQAVHALQESWKGYRTNLKESRLHNLREVLKYLLQHYLRIGDGMVLLESGECRHVGDYPLKNYVFTSQLTKNQVRGDGYTMLYSKDLKYSGFGWDEFFDDQYGVRVRLLRALQKISGKSTTTIWEILLETGGQLFESSFDTQETDVQAVRKSLESFRDTVKQDILHLLHQFGGGGGKVHFATQDKMEFIEVKMRKEVAGISSFKLQRRGNDFQVKDKEGVLPDGWNHAMWKRHMELSPRIKTVVAAEPAYKSGTAKQKKPKRRLIIEDSSDEENGDAGFHIRENKIQDVKTNDMSSLNAIKTDLGVDASELETAREDLEAEQQPRIKPSGQNTREVIDCDIKTARSHVEKLRKVLQYTLDEQDDPLEIWDAREHLRQATMQLGNDLLEIQSPASSEHLVSAKAYFKQATELVVEQEELHRLIVKDTNDDTEGAWLMRRNLLLLKGRARTNCGIALLDLSLIPKMPLVARKKNRLEAISELSLAGKCANSLQLRSISDKDRGASASETAMNIIEATQLEALALRSYGSALWHDGKQAAAIAAFENASCTYKKIEKSTMQYVENETEFLSLYLSNLAECYFSSTTLFDLIATKAERLQMMGPNEADSKRRGKDLIVAASIAVKAAKLVVQFFEDLTSKSTMNNPEGLLAEYGLLTEDDIDAALNHLNSRWEQRVEKKAIPERVLRTSDQIKGLPRSELGVGMLTNASGPKRRFIVSDSTRVQQSQNRQGANKDSFDFDYNPRRGEDTASPLSILPVVYMKWGDELLSDLGKGLETQLPYPASAPPRPSGFPLQ